MIIILVFEFCIKKNSDKSKKDTTLFFASLLYSTITVEKGVCFLYRCISPFKHTLLNIVSKSNHQTCYKLSEEIYTEGKMQATSTRFFGCLTCITKNAGISKSLLKNHILKLFFNVVNSQHIQKPVAVIDSSDNVSKSPHIGQSTMSFVSTSYKFWLISKNSYCK